MSVTTTSKLVISSGGPELELELSGELLSDEELSEEELSEEADDPELAFAVHDQLLEFPRTPPLLI